MYESFIKNKKIIDFVLNVEKEIAEAFADIEKVYEVNQLKVLKSFIDNRLSETHFIESTGYGYNDDGRDIIEKIYANIFKTEDALVRMQIASGTHAIAIGLFGCLDVGDKILSINGLPYDTIRPSIGLNNEEGSLKRYGVSFDYVDLIDGKNFDKDTIKKKIDEKTKLIMLQRSRGYSERAAFSIGQLEDIIKYVKSIKNDVIIFVDNCYGEFVDTVEPSEVGADIVCGSLIKNLGGGLARAGGYIVGKKDIIERCSYRLTAPGIGREVGINFNQNRNMLQGLYLAPQMVKNALKVSRLFQCVYEKLGFDTNPKSSDKLNDIVVRICLGESKKLSRFCEAIQATSPVDAFVAPVMADMPGYDHKVIMAAGNFISGSSIELSCDAPDVAPYNVYLQGGLSYYQGKLALMKTIENLELECFK